MKQILRARTAAACGVLMLLAACHDDHRRSSSDVTPPPPPVPQNYTVGGSVSGLSGTGLRLQINGAESIAIAGNGAFAFPTAISAGASFAVVVAAQPATPAQVCTVSGGTGTISAHVTNVAVVCATTTYTLGGTVSGLVGSGLTLASGTGENLSITGNGSFVFPMAIADSAAYDVIVASQPVSPVQTCTSVNGSGTIAANVSNVSIVCTTHTYSVGATVSGLSGTGLVLQLNGGNDLPVAANGTFTFTPSLIDGESYAVSVLTQPSGPLQTCVVASGAGTISANSVTASVVCTVNRYTVGGTVAGLVGHDMVLNNGIEQVTVDANGSFTFPTPLDVGASYDISIDHSPGAPAQHCVVANGSGTLGAANVTNASVACDLPLYPTLMLAAVPQENTVDVLAIEENGTLRMREPVPAGTTPRDVAIYKAAGTMRFAYVANANSDNVSAFSYDVREGKLHEVAGSPFATGGSPSKTTLHPTLPFLYVTNDSSRTVRAFSLDPASGVLTDRGAVTLDSPMIKVMIEPSGRYAYMFATFGTPTLQTFAINQDTGALSEVPSSAVTISGRTTATFDGRGRHLYVFDALNNVIHAYLLDAATGRPQPLTGSPFASGGVNLSFQALHPNGRFIYASPDTGTSREGVTVFAIQPGGLLTRVTGSPFGSGIFVRNVQPEPTGHYLYAQDWNDGGLMHRYSVDTMTGALSVQGTTAFPQTGSLAPMNIDNRGRLYHLASSAILGYGIDASTGALSPLHSGVTHTGGLPSFLALDEDSAPLEFVSEAVVSVSNFDITSNRLFADGRFGFGTMDGIIYPDAVTIAPSGRNVYVSKSGHTIASFSLDPATAALNAFSDEVQLVGPPLIEISRNSRIGYAANQSTTRLSTFAMDADTGDWGALPSNDTLAVTPEQILMHPSGRYLFVRPRVGGPEQTRLYAYRIAGATGAIDFAHYSYWDLGGASGGMVVHPSGSFIYVVNTEDDLIQAYQLQGYSPSLNPLNTVALVADGETSLAIDARGRFLFAINASQKVQTFAIGEDGQLTDLGDRVPYVVQATALTTDYSGSYLIVLDLGVQRMKIYRIGDDGTSSLVNTEPTRGDGGVHAVKATEQIQ